MTIRDPGLTQEEARTVPSAQYCGADGSEWVPGNVYDNDIGVTAVTFESWVFGVTNITALVHYAEDLAERFGAELELRLED